MLVIYSNNSSILIRTVVLVILYIDRSRLDQVGCDTMSVNFKL